MKTVLILVLSCDAAPYGKMIDTALNTWDSVNVEGVETKYYCGETGRKQNRPNVIYLPVKESLLNMGEKTLQALQYALNNFKFDYIARVHSSCYVDKKRLIEYVQGLPDVNVFAGAEVTDTPRWMWGGGHFVISKDVVQQIIANKSKWNHHVMEDKGMSYLVDSLGIPFTQGKSCSINKTPIGIGFDWLLLACGEGTNIEINEWSDVKKETNHFYRVKQDGNRDLDEVIMKELFECLQ